MPERWRSELNKLQRLDPPDRPWDGHQPRSQPLGTGAAGKRIATIVFALLIAVGAFFILSSAFSKGGTQAASDGIGASYTDRGVSVTYEKITGTLHRQNDVIITQGTGRPAISQRDAVATAWHPEKYGELPGRIVTAFVEWNGGPFWIVSLQGGNTCSPYTGPVSQPRGAPVCVNFITYRIDSSSGQVVETFSDGHLVPASQTASTPVPSLVDILEGNGGASPPSPAPVGSDAAMAKDLGISISEAKAALKLEPQVGALHEALSKRTDITFGGLFISYNPYQITILASPGTSAEVNSAVKATVSDLQISDLAPYIKVAETRFTEPVLLEARADLVKLDINGLLTSSDIDIQTGRVLLTAAANQDVATLRALADSAQIPIPADHVDIQVGGTTSQ